MSSANFACFLFRGLVFLVLNLFPYIYPKCGNIGKAVQICQSATNVKVQICQSATNVKVQICQSRAKCQSVKLVAAHLYKAAVVNVSVWQSAEKARGASLTNRRPTLLTHASLALERERNEGTQQTFDN